MSETEKLLSALDECGREQDRKCVDQLAREIDREIMKDFPQLCRRLAVLAVDAEVLVQIMRTGQVPANPMIPAGAEVVGLQLNAWNRTICVLLRHPEFHPVPECGLPPTIPSPGFITVVFG